MSGARKLSHACAESLYSVVDDMRMELERIVVEELRKSYINQARSKFKHLRKLMKQNLKHNLRDKIVC